MTGQATLPSAGGMRFDIGGGAVEGLQAQRVTRRAWAHPLRRGLGMRGPMHEVLADAHGLWAWAPHDSYAAASRHACLQRWMEANAGCDMRLWVSAELMRSLDGVKHLPRQHDEQSLRAQAQHEFATRHGEAARAWPLATWKSESALGVLALAGLDLDALRGHAQKHDVRMQAVVPWWHHAFLEAKRCVNAVSGMARAQVCVVEGKQVAWITTQAGTIGAVQQYVLSTGTVGSLCDAIKQFKTTDSTACGATIVLGHGLSDGSETRGLDALVLGRLDGDQPPQWLRPTTQIDMH